MGPSHYVSLRRLTPTSATRACSGQTRTWNRDQRCSFETMSLKPSASVPTVYHRGDEPMVRPSSAAALRPWSGASERGAAVAAAKAKEKSTVEALNDSLSAARSESQVLSSELSSLKHELSKIRNTPTGLQLLMHASMAATPSQVPRSAQEAALPRPQSAASQRDIAFRGSGPMAPKFAHAPPRTPDLESRKVWRQSSGRSQPQLSRPVDTPVAVLNEQQQQQFSEYLRSLGLNAPSMMHKPSANARRNAPASLARLPPPQPRAAPPSAHAIQPGTGARLAAVNPVQSQPFHMPGHPPVPKQQLRSSLVGSTASAPGTASGKHRSPLAGAHHAAASTAPRAARPRPSTPGAPARPPNMAWREQPKAPPTAPPAPPTVTFQADTTLQRKPSAGASTRRAPQAAATAETAAPAVAPQPVVPAPAPQQDTAQPPKPTSAPDAAPPVQPEQAAPPPEAPPPLPWEPPAPAPAPAPREPMRSFAETLALAKWEPPPAALQTAAQPPPPPPPPAADGDGGGGGGGSGAVSFFEGALPGEDADVALEMSRVRAAAVRRAVQLRSSHGATQLVALFRGWDADPGTPTIARGLLPREEFARRLAMMGELDAEPALVEKLLDASLAPPPPPLPSGADRVFGGDNTKRCACDAPCTRTALLTVPWPRLAAPHARACRHPLLLLSSPQLVPIQASTNGRLRQVCEPAPRTRKRGARAASRPRAQRGCGRLRARVDALARPAR